MVEKGRVMGDRATLEEQEHLAVKIKYRGQCPSWKGHAAGAFGGGVFVAFIISFFVGTVLLVSQNEWWKHDTLTKGCASYNAAGYWHWKER